MKRLLLAFFAVLLPSLAMASSELKLEPAPINPQDRLSLQRGARAFVNHCLNCHSAQYMRYSRLTDLGLTEPQIKENLLFTSDKIGAPMQTALRPADAKAFFGAMPPDLTVIGRSRGADWLYAYMKNFYRDESRPTGWNNLVFPGVGMPHVVWNLQGDQVLKETKTKDASGHEHVNRELELARPGALSKHDYDVWVADLVNYLVYMAEPARSQRQQLGVIVLFFLTILFFAALWLKKEYWKDVK